MKKNILGLFAVFMALPVMLSAGAVASAFDKEVKTNKQAYAYTVSHKQSFLSEWFAQAFTDEVSKQIKKADAQSLAKLQYDKAADSLRALQIAYPEQEMLLSYILDDHEILAESSKEKTDSKSALLRLSFYLDMLNKHLDLLRLGNDDVAEQVKQILRHEYWFGAEGDLVTFEKLKEKVYRQCRTGKKWHTDDTEAWYKNL